MDDNRPKKTTVRINKSKRITIPEVITTTNNISLGDTVWGKLSYTEGTSSYSFTTGTTTPGTVTNTTAFATNTIQNSSTSTSSVCFTVDPAWMNAIHATTGSSVELEIEGVLKKEPKHE